MIFKSSSVYLPQTPSPWGRALRIAGDWPVKWIITALLLGTIMLPANAQTVAIQNVSAPGTALEPGDTVGIYISGAAADEPVTVITNGGSPYLYGYTDGSGTWSTTSPVISGDVGDWAETWYVNGVEATPANSELGFAPTLPDFTIYSNYAGGNCPGQLATAAGCGESTPLHWIFTPIGYDSTSSQVTSTDVDYAAMNWNYAQSRVSLAAATSPAIVVYDDSDIDYLGYTYIYGMDCTGCFDYTDQCGGGCFNSSAAYMDEIALNATAISGDVTLLNAGYALNSSVFGGAGIMLTDETYATFVLIHELGHALELSHPGLDPVGRCSEVQSIMYQYPYVSYACDLVAPSSCDGSVLTDTIYPSSPPTCTPTDTSNYCYEDPGYACS